MTLSINNARFNASSITRASGLITHILSSRIVRRLNHIRRARNTSIRFSNIAFSTSQERFRILLVRYTLRIRQNSTMTNRLSKIRPRTRKVFLFTPSKSTTRIKGNLRLFFSHRINSFTRLRRQTFFTLRNRRRSKNNVNVNFQCHKQITIT